MEYIAFISYRHLPLDKAVAQKLSRQIERFVIPKRLRKQGKARLGRVFRDDDELPLSSSLTDDLYHALDNSEYLIMVCTPELPKSRYCMEELRYFLTKHSRDKVLTVLASGTPEQSFPPELLKAVDPVTGEERYVEPLAANILAKTQRASLRKLNHEKLRIIASLLHCKYDDLVQRMKKHKRQEICALTAICLVIAAAVAALVAANLKEREKKLYNQAIANALKTQNLLDEGRRMEALDAILDAFPTGLDGKPIITEPGIHALVDASAAYETNGLTAYNVIDCDSAVTGMQLTEDGKQLLIYEGTIPQKNNLGLTNPGLLTVYRLDTLERAYSIQAQAGLFESVGDYLVCRSDDSSTKVYRVSDGQLLYAINEKPVAVFLDKAGGQLLLDNGASFLRYSLQDGSLLSETAHGKDVIAEGFAVTLDGKYSMVMYSGAGLVPFWPDQAKATIEAMDTEGGSISYELPFTADASLTAAERFFIYTCSKGVYLIDPACVHDFHEKDEPYAIMSFEEFETAVSPVYTCAGKRAVLVLTPYMLLEISMETGAVVNMLDYDPHGPVRACAWVDEDKLQAVFLTAEGYAYQFYDYHPDRTEDDLVHDRTHFLTHVQSMGQLNGTVDNAASAKGNTVWFAARSRRNTHAVSLYTYHINERASYISPHRPTADVMELDLPEGYLLRYNGYQEETNTCSYTLLHFDGGEWTEHPFELDDAFNVTGVSPDGELIYTDHKVYSLSTGQFREVMTPEQAERYDGTNQKDVYFKSLDDRGKNLRMCQTLTGDGKVHAVVMADDALLWEDELPIEWDDFWESIGKNGWAFNWFHTGDDQFLYLLVDLYSHQFTTVNLASSAEYYMPARMGKKADSPVFAYVGENGLNIVDCVSGKTVKSFQLPMKPSSVTGMEFFGDDRYMLLKQSDMTVTVLDLSDGQVRYQKPMMNADYYDHFQTSYMFETEGEFCYTFRNPGWGVYMDCFAVDTNTWEEKWAVPRVHTVLYGPKQLICMDSTYTECYSIPMLEPEELLREVQKR